MLKIYIARHGQDEDNKNGILNGHRNEPLTNLGEQQAKVVGEEILNKGLRFDFIYSSPLQGAFKTAQIISKASNQPEPLVLNDLIERDFGIMTGKRTNEIEDLCSPRIIKSNTITYFLDPEGAETFPDLLIRARKLLELIKNKHNDKSILLVSHGDFGKMIYTAFYNLPWEEVLTDFHFGNSEILFLAEGNNPKESRLFTVEQHNH